MSRRSALVVAALAVTTAVLTTPAAAAQESPSPADEPAVRASLTTVDPAAPEPGGTLTLGGSVENVGDEPLANVQAVLRFDENPLDNRTDVRRVATDREVAWGQRDPVFFDAELGGEELSPGETDDFTVSVLLDEIDLAEPGVYVIGVDIRATPIENGDLVANERFTADTTRTVIPWLPGNDPLPQVPVTLLWPLAAQPSVLPDGTLLGDGLADQLGAGGSLSGLVAAPGDAPVTWGVDPDLLATVGAMAQGYTVSSTDGTTTDGTGADDAAAWLESYTAATEGAQPLLVPFANPDIEALAAADSAMAAQTARDAFAATRTFIGDEAGSAPNEVAWPTGGAVGEDALAAYASANAATVLLSGKAVTPETDEVRARVRAGDSEMDAVITDGGLDTAIADAAGADDPAAGAVAIRQSWLAETAMVALDAAGSGGLDDGTAADAAPLAATAPYGWQPDRAVAQALIGVWTETAWIVPTPLAALAVPESPTVVAPRSVDDTVPAPLPPDYVAAVTDLGERGAQYAALLAEPNGVTSRLDTAVLRSASSSWRTDVAAGTAYTAAATATAASGLDQVSVQVPPSVTLSSSKGTFPLTVSNDLDQPVLVGLQLLPDNPDRMSVADVTDIRVEAGEKATVEVTAEAAVKGKVPMTVQLTDVDGSPLGASQRTIVNATDYGTIGWVVVGGAAAMLLAAAALRPRRRRTDDDDEPATVVVAAEPEPQRETAR
jgi:Family of unknown function (DUF6049)